MSAHTSPDEMAARRLPLGEFVLDLVAGELFTADGQIAGLRKQALDVLLVLGRHADQVVGKDELMRLVWPNVVVGEGSLTQAIADIRRVLGDSEHRVIRNVARRGYMLVPDTLPAAAVERPEVDSTPAAPTPATPPVPGAQAWSRRWLRVVIVLVLLIAAGTWLTWRETPPSWHTPATLARAPLPRDVPPLSIIVLPLAIEGESKEMEWFADALHGDLVIEVARLHHSLVIARDTAATYKGKAVDPRQVAREMGVRHVVSGSLRQEGPQILLNLALIDGETGVQQWAETFSIDRARLPQTLGDFAVAIERTLAAELFRSTVERRAALSPTEVSADDLAMRGFALWYRGVTRENVLEALALYERAVAMDPDSARAWAGIAFTTAAGMNNSWLPDRASAMRRIEEATAQLERLDRDGTYTYSAIATQIFLKRDFPALLRHTTAWTERYRLPTAFGARGTALMFNGRFDEAAPVLERALRLSPHDPFRAEWQYRLAMAHFAAGRYELARDWSQTAAATNSALPWPPIHAAALHRLGQIDAAQQAFDEHMRRHPTFTAGQIKPRLPSDEPAFAEARERLIASLRQLGLRD
jgi:adenylate cyclase